MASSELYDGDRAVLIDSLWPSRSVVIRGLAFPSVVVLRQRLSPGRRLISAIRVEHPVRWERPWSGYG